MSDKPSFLNGTRHSSPEQPSMTAGSQAENNLDPLEFDEAIRNIGLVTLWEKSYLCPCRNRATRQPNQTCKLCQGRGIAYFPPKQLLVMIQSQDKSVSNSDLGLIDSGTAIGTNDRAIQIAFRDRITLKNVDVSQSFIFDASENRIKNGFFMIYDVKQIEFATTLEGELFEGKDYTVDYMQNIFYPKDHLSGKNISLNIKTTLRYLVADLLKEHRYAKKSDGSIEKMPQKLLLKREDIFIAREAFELGSDNDEVQEMVDPKRMVSHDGLNGFFGGSRNGKA